LLTALLNEKRESVMFNNTQRSIAKNTLIAAAILLSIFIGNKLWQEYQLYQTHQIGDQPCWLKSTLSE
jgi:hypothetical protein